MIKIKIYSTGKVKEHWLELALEEYTKRLSKSISIEWVLFKEEDKLYKEALLETNLVALTPDGAEYESIEFSKKLFYLIERNQSRLSILIGGAEGIPRNLIEKVPKLSLSKLTWSHQTTRLLLLEQIYRAYTLHEGINYHK
jgi:23S rRNA (pseudouridine1915-N3)-methyltransferase